MNITATSQQIVSQVSSNKRHLAILLLGISSGLPASLTASTLQAWFTDAGIDLHAIGAVTLLVLPYSFRFLWSPLFDYLPLPGLGRRRGWLLLLQIGLILTLIWMAFITPQQNFLSFLGPMPWLMLAGFITAFLSASQDIVINAYQTEILPKEQQGLGASIYVTGWRTGAILSGALALILASKYGWQQTYLFMASLMSIGIVGTAIAHESPEFIPITMNLTEAVIAPFKEFIQRLGYKTAMLFFLLILTYKAGDALALALNTTFLMRHIGFDLETLGYVNKTVSLFAALFGGLTAGVLMTRLSLYRALMLFGFIQGAANLCYAGMAYWGKSLSLLIFSAFTENFCSGMGSIALIALIMTLCNKRYTATQFALLSAIAFLARTFVGPVAASLVDAVGWMPFFIWCFVLSMPTLLFVYLNKGVIEREAIN